MSFDGLVVLNDRVLRRKSTNCVDENYVSSEEFCHSYLHNIGDAYETFLTYSEMDTAILTGKDIQVGLDPSECTLVEGIPPDYLVSFSEDTMIPFASYYMFTFQPFLLECA